MSHIHLILTCCRRLSCCAAVSHPFILKFTWENSSNRQFKNITRLCQCFIAEFIHEWRLKVLANIPNSHIAVIMDSLPNCSHKSLPENTPHNNNFFVFWGFTHIMKLQFLYGLGIDSSYACIPSFVAKHTPSYYNARKQYSIWDAHFFFLYTETFRDILPWFGRETT